MSIFTTNRLVYQKLRLRGLGDYFNVNLAWVFPQYQVRCGLWLSSDVTCACAAPGHQPKPRGQAAVRRIKLQIWYAKSKYPWVLQIGIKIKALKFFLGCFCYCVTCAIYQIVRTISPQKAHSPNCAHCSNFFQTS